MLILQALTAKKQTVTLAFALVPSESKESWDFFSRVTIRGLTRVHSRHKRTTLVRQKSYD